MYTLYGDGVHDDYPAIQEMLDSRTCEVALPIPQKHYLISQTLKIHSYQRLLLPRFATIRLADGANCPMLANDDKEKGTVHFAVQGGIWDYNNQNQAPNPVQVHNPDLPHYTGRMMELLNIRNFTFSDMTLKDPVNYCLELDMASYFTVENLVFDFNYGNPTALNMDGVHVNGNSHYGLIRNCRGACYDDLVALNADEGSAGPITHIEIDGIFAEDCHSAVRLLSVECPVKHIHIHNVHGTYYQYCIGVTKYYEGAPTGGYSDLVFENIHAAKAERYSVYQKDGTFEYPLIWMERNLHITSLVLRDIYREEQASAVPLIAIEPNTVIDRLRLENIRQTDALGLKPPVFVNEGVVNLMLSDNTVDAR